MNVILAVIGSRGLGEPKRYEHEIFLGSTLYSEFRNIGQFNYAVKRLNDAVMRITARERETNPDFDPRKHLSVIIGDADGADEITRLWAVKNQLNYEVKVAKWRVHGNSAGHIRNPDIIKPADYIVAFWDGVSTGTESGIKLAKRLEKKINVIRYLKHAPNLKRSKLIKVKT